MILIIDCGSNKTKYIESIDEPEIIRQGISEIDLLEKLCREFLFLSKVYQGIPK